MENTPVGFLSFFYSHRYKMHSPLTHCGDLTFFLPKLNVNIEHIYIRHDYES